MRSTLILHSTLLLALLLELLLFPSISPTYYPNWVLLFVCAWALFLPHTVNIGTAFTYGILLDILQGTVLGSQALALSVAAYLFAAYSRRIKNLSLWQQAFGIAAHSGLITQIKFLNTYISSSAVFNLNMLWSIPINALTWLPVYFVVQNMREASVTK